MRPRTDFSRGSVKEHILAQALPLTVAQLVQLLYNVVDRIYIGHLPQGGELALTGLGICFPVIILIAAVTNLFGTGGATLFAIARGRGDTEEAEGIIGTVFTLLSGFSLLLMALCLLFRRPVLTLFGASPQSLPFAERYLRLYLWGTPCSMIATGLNGYINAQGFPRVGMLTTVLGALINVLLDPIFIFVLDMGVEGAALATVISQTVSAFWVMRFLLGKRAILRLKRQHLGVRRERLLPILSLGLPGFVMQGTNSLVSIVCNNQLQLYGGDLYVGIMTVLTSVREMISVPLSGMTHGAQPVMGFNYGAGEKDRVKACIRFSAILGSCYLLLAWLAVFFLPEQLMGIFTEDAATVSIGAQMLHIYFFGFVFMAFQSAGQTTFQALGKARQAIFFSLFRKVIIVVPLTLLLPALGFGVKGVFLAEPVSNVLGGLAAFTTMYFTVYRKL
ncbi:MAG: MATE family efflux transporter [Clostridia bacterium]|nr:MATE family efflux transporter [Clostridia bacterium]